MYIEGTKRSEGKILIPVDSIVLIQETANYSSGYFVTVTVKDLRLYPLEFQGKTIYNEIEYIELEDDFNAFTFLYKVAKGLENETTEKHKET